MLYMTILNNIFYILSANELLHIITMQEKLCIVTVFSGVHGSVILHKILSHIVIISFRNEILGICRVQFFLCSRKSVLGERFQYI